MRKLKGVIRYLHRNYFLPRFLSWKHKNLLQKNLSLKGMHKGKRCFLVGGGPSVKDLDLGRLKDEFTFVMGEFDNNPQFERLNPKFYVISDSTYFTEGESEYWNKQFEKKDKSIPESTIILTSLDAKPYVQKHNLFNRHKYFYFGSKGIMTENFPFNMELDRYLPLPKNSMLLCLFIAAYLGFEEIYLLGCEHNFLCFSIGQGKAISYDYGHEDDVTRADVANDEVVKRLAVPRDLTMTYEENIAHVLQLFKNYRLFYKKVRETHPNVKILNATPNSYLDVFPMIQFKNIEF